MNNATCSKCNKPFEMGGGGIYTDNGDLCDSCANVTRTANGEAYENQHPYELRRPVSNLFQGGASVRPGDFAVLHPNRKR